MEVSFDVMKNHLVDFSIYNVRNSEEIKKAVKIQTYVTPLMFSIFAIAIGVYQKNINKWLLIFLGMYVAWVIIYPKIYITSVKNTLRKTLDQVNGKEELIGSCKLILTDDGIIEESNVRTHKMEWNELLRLIETKEYVFVFNSENSAYVIPKEKFTSSEYSKEYINMLSTKSGKLTEQWV